MGTIRPGIYRHFKNKKYKVLFCATHTETEEEMVVYRALYGDYRIWVRPRKMFVENVEVDGKTVSRFEFISESEE